MNVWFELLTGLGVVYASNRGVCWLIGHNWNRPRATVRICKRCGTISYRLRYR